MSYHVNLETGKVGVCKAKIECPFKENAEHFENIEDAYDKSVDIARKTDPDFQEMHTLTKATQAKYDKNNRQIAITESDLQSRKIGFTDFMQEDGLRGVKNKILTRNEDGYFKGLAMPVVGTVVGVVIAGGIMKASGDMSAAPAAGMALGLAFSGLMAGGTYRYAHNSIISLRAKLKNRRNEEAREKMIATQGKLLKAKGLLAV